MTQVLGAWGPTALLLLLAPAGFIYQARDVDLLLYAAAAVRGHAEGALPYVAAWIEKGPLAMGLFQALFMAFGDWNLLAVGLAWLALALAGVALSRTLARELGASEVAAAAGAGLFALSLGSVGGTLNTEVPASIAAAAAVILWCRSRRATAGAAPRLAGAAGLAAAAALLCRQNAGVLGPVLLGAEFFIWARRPGRTAAGLGPALAFALGFLLPVLAVPLVYLAAGSLADLVFCVWTYNTDIYVKATRVTPMRLARMPLDAATNFLLPVRTVGFAGLIGLVLAWRRGTGTRRVTALAAAALFLSLFAGLRFFSHYFALVLPIWAALAALTVDGLFRIRRREVRIAALTLLIGSAGAELAMRPALPGLRDLAVWVRDGGALHPTDLRGWPRRDGLAARAAAWIRERAAPGDRVFVWGMRPHVPAYAGLVPATRFVTSTFLTGLVPWEQIGPAEATRQWIVPGSWDLLMQDLERERPRFIVDASVDHMFGEGAHAIEHYPLLRDYLRDRYEQGLEAGDMDRLVVWVRRAEGN